MSTYTNLLFHIVYSTKYRRAQITDEFRDRLYAYIGTVVSDKKGILLAIGGMPDHVHLLAKLSPTLAVSDVLRFIKSNSSKWVNETIDRPLPFAWQRGFAAFSVSSSNSDAVRMYVQNQAEHHRKLSFKDEFRQLLIKHGIEFDEQYLFEEEHVA